MVTYLVLYDFTAYRLGDDGSVWSRWKKGKNPSISDNWKVLKCMMLKNGYKTITLHGENGEKRTVLVHVLMLETFVGPRPQGYEGCHNNGVRHDNRLENLRWDTVESNQADRKIHGTVSPSPGEKNGNHKLNETQVKEIRLLHSQGESMRGIAKQFGISKASVENIIHRRTWSHLQ